jgi:hypothetical protein
VSVKLLAKGRLERWVAVFVVVGGGSAAGSIREVLVLLISQVGAKT